MNKIGYWPTELSNSRGEPDEVNYGSDVELEIDLTQQRRTRRREKKVVYSSDSGNEYEDTGMPEESSSEEEEADDDDGNVEFVYGPKERKTSLSSSPPTVKPTVRRTKRGRPSKSELVLGQIKSIFHQDDVLFSTDRKTFTPTKPTAAKNQSAII